MQTPLPTSPVPSQREHLFLFYSKLRNYLVRHDVSRNQLDVLLEVFSRLSSEEEENVVWPGELAATETQPASRGMEFSLLEQKVELYRVYCKILQQEHRQNNAKLTEEAFEKGLLMPQRFLMKNIHQRALERKWRHHAQLESAGGDQWTHDQSLLTRYRHQLTAAHFSADSNLSIDTMPLPNGSSTLNGDADIPPNGDTPPNSNSVSHSHSSASSPEIDSVESNLSSEFGFEEDDYQQFVRKRPQQQLTSWRKWQNFLKRITFALIPILSWIIPYFRWHFCINLLHDFIAGTAVAAVLVPQSMAYSLLAGLPPEYGLYTSFIPLFVYFIFGSSRHLALGPVSLVSLLNASAVSDLPTTEARITTSLLIAFQAGVFQLLLGILRMGYLVNFLSTTVISGFTSAAGVLIFFTQLKHIFGINITSDRQLHVLLSSLFAHIHETQWQPVVFGCVCILVLLFFHYFRFHFHWRGKRRKFTFKLFPVHLILLLSCVLVIYLLAKDKRADTVSKGGLQVRNIKILGPVPTGVPKPTTEMLRSVTWKGFFLTLRYSTPIGFISFLESISAAKFFATKHDYNLDANQELIALGLASTIGSFFRSYTATGALSRSAVASQAGAVSILYSLVVFVFVLMTLIFLTGLFYYLPLPLLAAIIIVAVLGLIDVKEFVECLRTKPRDALCLAVAFIVTLFIGVEYGILIAIAVSIVLIVYSMSIPNIVTLGRVMGTQNYRNVKAAKRYKGILILRFDASLLFLNVNHLEENAIRMVRHNKYEVQVFILECSGINSIDAAGVKALVELFELMEQKYGVRTFFSQMKRPVRNVCRRGRLTRQIPPDRFFFQTHEAVLAAEKHIIARNRMKALKSNRDVIVARMTISESANGERIRTVADCVVSGGKVVEKPVDENVANGDKEAEGVDVGSEQGSIVEGDDKPVEVEVRSSPVPSKDTISLVVE